MRLAGMGLQFAGGAIGFGALGWWIDTMLGSEPWGMLIGGSLGLIGGMYLLIKDALAAQKDAINRIQQRKTTDKPTPTGQQDRKHTD